DDERHTEQRWDQEQQATQEIFSHGVPVLGSVEASLIIVTLSQYQDATQMERRNAPQTPAGLYPLWEWQQSIVVWVGSQCTCCTVPRYQATVMSSDLVYICSISRRTRTALLASSTTTSTQRTNSPTATGRVTFQPGARPSGKAPACSESAAGSSRPTTV